MNANEKEPRSIRLQGLSECQREGEGERERYWQTEDCDEKDRQRSKEEWNNSSVLSNAGFTLDKAGIFMTSVYTISPTTIYQKCVSSRAAHYEYACTYLSHQFH